jgi:hypothetical protein
MSEFDELHKLELDLTAAPAAAIPNIVKAVGVSAGKGKRAWQAEAKRHRYSGGFPASIDYDTAKLVDGAIVTELGPNLDRGVGTPGLGIVEDSPAGVHGTPQRNYLKAEAVIGDDLEHGVEIAIDQALRKLGL